MELAIIILGSIAVATGNLIIKNNKNKRNGNNNGNSRDKRNNYRSNNFS